MRIVIGLLAVTAAACGDDGGMFPVGGGGNDGGFTLPDTSGGGGTDAARDGATDGTVALIDANIFTGRVCLATDPRKLNECASTGAGGLTVRLGSATATTTADGTFMIEGQSGSGLVWRISGPNIVSSYKEVGDYEIPAITRATYSSMITNNLGGLQPNPGEGAVMIQVIENGVGRDSAFASSSPTSTWAPFYDGTDNAAPTVWNQGATGANGAIWITGLDVGSASVTVTYIDDVVLGGLPVFDGGITFATAIFAPP
jgi:hypothetical protein